MYIKVDYSLKRKGPNGHPDMPGEFAIYTKAHWWEKWIQGDTYASLDFAIRDAERLREAEKRLRDLPKYF